MKLHRVILFVLVAISLAFGGVAMAGDGHGKKHHKQKRMAKWQQMSDQEKQEFIDKKIDRLDAKLDLSDDQEAQIRQIIEQTRTEVHDLKSQDGDRKAKRGQMREIRKQTHQEIADVLDDDQLDTFEELKEKRRKRFKNRMRHKRQQRGGHGQ